MGKKKESGYRAGSQVLRIPSAHGNRSLFFVYFYYTTTIFMLGEGEEFARHSPFQHCSLPRVCNYCRMQEESHSLRRRNSSDLTS